MKETLDKAVKYASALKSKLSDVNLPSKHKDRPAEYKAFLTRELAKVNVKIDGLKLSGAETKK